MRRSSRLCAALVVAFASSAAWAQDNAAAQALFDDARALMAQGDYPAACKKLEGSLALDPGAGTEFNLALCYEKSGRTASAWATYLSAATGYHASNRLDWEERARARARALAGTLSRVTIVPPATAAGLHVVRDGKALLASELDVALPVDPGHHVIEATADGGLAFRAELDLASGASQTLRISLVASGPRHSPPPRSKVAKPLAFVVGGLGIVGLGVGTASGLVAIGRNARSRDVCPNDGPCSSAAARTDNHAARSWASVSTMSFVSGVVLVAAGVVLYVVAPKAAPRSSLRAELSW